MELKEILYSMKTKRYALLGAVFLVAAFLIYWGVSRFATARRTAEVKKEEVVKFKSLEEEYLRKKAVVDSVAKKAYVSDPTASPIAALERMGSRVGIKELITSLKPLEERQEAGYTEKAVEVKIEKIDLNQLVSLLYVLENDRELFVVREFSMKGRFENPDLLDVTLKVAHLVKQKS